MRINLPEYVNFIIMALQKNGFKAYAVGGCVRDYLLRLTPVDFDVCTSAKPDEIKSLFEKTVDTGIKHGTITVISGKTAVEVTTFRTDGKYNDFRKPESVKFVDDLKSDLSRRDFTVNALCYNDDGGLIDYFGGIKDLKSKTLRTVGTADLRFKEDALRILRLFRFASTLCFTPENETLKSALENSNLLKNISAERISKELYLLSAGKNIAAVLPLLKTGAFPFLKPNDEILKIPALNGNARLKFFAFLNLSSISLSNTLKVLKCSNEFKNYCLNLNSCLSANIKNREDLKRTLSLLENDIFDLLSYKSAILNEDTEELKLMAKEIIETGEPYKLSQLAASGEDILKKGYKGEEIGEILSKLLKAVIKNPELNKKDILESMF